jgi:hypothetical protein
MPEAVPEPTSDATDDAPPSAGLSDSPSQSISELRGIAPTNFPGEVLLRALLVEYQHQLQPRAPSAKTTLAKVSASFGLEVLPLRIELPRLKQFRVACVVETSAANAPEPGLQIVRGTSPEGIELSDAAGEVRRLTDSEFAKRWSGQVYLFHRRGLELRSVLAQGQQNPQVRTLQQRLSDLGYLQGDPSGVFDEATTEAVRRFQRDHALQVDGAAGPATKIVLYHVAGRALAEVRQE